MEPASITMEAFMVKEHPHNTWTDDGAFVKLGGSFSMKAVMIMEQVPAVLWLFNYEGVSERTTPHTRDSI